MSGLFRRKKEKTSSPRPEDDDFQYLDLITKKVNDANGNFFGEVVSADGECFIIKHSGGFYRFPVNNVQDKFGDLMLTSNIDLKLARKQGDQWKDPGKDIIRENKVYDFSDKKRLEQERNNRILLEMEKARDLALQTTIGNDEPDVKDIVKEQEEQAEKEQEKEEEEQGEEEEEEGRDVEGDEEGEADIDSDGEDGIGKKEEYEEGTDEENASPSNDDEEEEPDEPMKAGVAQSSPHDPDPSDEEPESPDTANKDPGIPDTIDEEPETPGTPDEGSETSDTLDKGPENPDAKDP